MLAEYASSHPDGTFSMLRAGLNRLHVEKIPAPFRATLVARMETDIADAGEHRFDIRCVDVDGKEVLPTQQGQFQAPQGGSNINLIIGISAAIPKLGVFVFYLRIDNVEVDSWTVTVVEKKKAGGTTEPKEEEA